MRSPARLIGLLLAAGTIVASLGPGADRWAAGQTSRESTGTSALRFAPESLTVESGRAASAKVTVTLSSGKAGGTDLHATDVPAGVAIGFDPASGEPPFTSTMTVTAAAGAQPGTSIVKVQATGGDPSAIAPYRLTVSKEHGY